MKAANSAGEKQTATGAKNMTKRNSDTMGLRTIQSGGRHSEKVGGGHGKFQTGELNQTK
jgi:hypothetical protein